MRAGASGLALALARDIIELHGGEVELAGTGCGGDASVSLGFVIPFEIAPLPQPHVHAQSHTHAHAQPHAHAHTHTHTQAVNTLAISSDVDKDDVEARVVEELSSDQPLYCLVVDGEFICLSRSNEMIH
jgi:hypothetical protein